MGLSDLLCNQNVLERLRTLFEEHGVLVLVILLVILLLMSSGSLSGLLSRLGLGTSTGCG